MHIFWVNKVYKKEFSYGDLWLYLHNITSEIIVVFSNQDMYGVAMKYFLGNIWYETVFGTNKIDVQTHTIYYVAS